MKEISPRIVVDKNIRGGKPVVKGTRVPVDIIIGSLAGGMSYEEICDEYGITKEDILACLKYTMRILEHEEIFPIEAK